MAETPPSDDDLMLLRRHWPHGDGADPAAVWTVAEAIYGGAKDWEREFAMDLVSLRPSGKGGLASAERIDRMAMKRWRSGERTFPDWVAEGLLKLPAIVLARRRAELEEAREAERTAKAVVVAEERRLRQWIAAQVERHVPSVERDPVKRPPPPRPPTHDREWSPVADDEIEAAEDLGTTAARVAMGVVEHEDAPRPDHPALADAWERGWSAAYDFELTNMREAAERRAAAKAEAEAAAEAKRTAKAAEEARKEKRRAADRKRRRSK